MVAAEEESVRVIIRGYEAEKDCQKVEEVERICEVGPSGKLSLFTDQLGDPVCRIRNSPTSLMLVAEIAVGNSSSSLKSEKREIVGMIRGCIKTVTCGKKLSRNGKTDPPPLPILVPILTKVAYILGLRVSPSHRRMKIGYKLVCKMEEWFRQNGAEYSYMATEIDNVASVKLFVDKCSYTKFRTPSILVQPVFAHRVKVSTRFTIIKLTPYEAELLYRRRFSTTEFFPRDIDSLLNNKLNLGTFMAIPSHEKWLGSDNFLAEPPESWAVMSVWNLKDVFKFQVRGASVLRKAFAKTTRVVDRALPFLRLPSVPEVFRPFGLHFMYGLGGEGPMAVKLTKALCGFAHNLAKEHGCSMVATEVSGREPLRGGIPHWKRLSCAEDLWCIKRLGEDYSDGSVGDWTKSKPGLSIFVDPREI